MFISEIGLTFCVYSLLLCLVHKNNLKIPLRRNELSSLQNEGLGRGELIECIVCRRTVGLAWC